MLSSFYLVESLNAVPQTYLVFGQGLFSTCRFQDELFGSIGLGHDEQIIQCIGGKP
jgi:hypothetical protein